MGKRILIGIVAFIILGLAIWRFLLPVLQGITTNKVSPNDSSVKSVATPSALVNLAVSESLEGVVGESVLMSKTQVKGIINDNIFWIGPESANRELIIINKGKVDVAAGDILSVSGIVQNISEVSQELGSWNLSKEDIETIKNNPIYIAGEQVKIIK